MGSTLGFMQVSVMVSRYMLEVVIRAWCGPARPEPVKRSKIHVLEIHQWELRLCEFVC